jgi:hypothetical protein
MSCCMRVGRPIAGGLCSGSAARRCWRRGEPGAAGGQIDRGNATYRKETVQRRRRRVACCPSKQRPRGLPAPFFSRMKSSHGRREIVGRFGPAKRSHVGVAAASATRHEPPRSPPRRRAPDCHRGVPARRGQQHPRAVRRSNSGAPTLPPGATLRSSRRRAQVACSGDTSLPSVGRFDG